MKSVYRHDLTMLAVINLWARLLFSDRESTVESGDAHTHTQFHAENHENTWRKKAAAGRFQQFRFALLLNRKSGKKF